MRYWFRPSIRVAPAGTFTDLLGPSAVIHPPCTSTVRCSSTRSRSIGTTATSANAVTPLGALGTGPRAGDWAVAAAGRIKAIGIGGKHPSIHLT